MNTRIIELTGGRKVAIAEAGQGAPLLYLHGFADVHGASVEWLPMHEELARTFRLIAPAHPGCAGSDENEAIDSIDDVEFHLLEVLDALGLAKADVVGNCFGGWLAAELAVRNPDRVNRLVLTGASGLFVPGEPIGDLFWEVQAQNGVEYQGLRSLLFTDGNADVARALFPDGRSVVEREISRYKVMRYASRVGFKPPYFYNRNLRDRLHRFPGEVLLLWGEFDRMVPLAHARAYEQGFKRARLQVVPDAAHALTVEQPDPVVAAIRAFLTPATIGAHRVFERTSGARAKSARKGAARHPTREPHAKPARAKRAADASRGGVTREAKRPAKRLTTRATKRPLKRPAKRPVKKRGR